MPNKRLFIIISIATIILVAAIVTAILVITSPHSAAPDTNSVKTNDPAKEDPLKQESQTAPDLSKDLGACTVITKSTVTTALGTTISTIGDGINRGYAKDNTGVESQSCTFALTTTDTVENRYSTTITVFSSTDALNTSKAAFTSMTKISGIGDAAYFSTSSSPASPTTGALNTYDVSVFSGTKLYTLDITQPADKDVFTSDTAKAALTKIAQSISF